MKPALDLRADLNAEDDEGQGWSLLRDAVDPSRVVSGALLIAGTTRHWSVVRITSVDADGQVHFVMVDHDDPAARRLLADSPNDGDDSV